MSKKIFNKENIGILRDKRLVIAIIAVIFVPVMYAGMFLWAFWDPYQQLDGIPVAIVNEDNGYHYEGEYLTLGDELIDKLKEEPEFDFHFVEKDDGYQGLKNQDYYLLIEIPKDFSKNSTTVMDNQPKKIDLVYKPNESYNFLASQIGETAMLHIEQELEEKIIETYAETIFDKIVEVANGLGEASDATEKLNDGASELKDGSKELQNHLKTLASKTIEFSDGVEMASFGSNELANGSRKLADGMNQLDDGGGKLLEASQEVQSGSKQLADGMTVINNGIQEMNGKVPDLVNGTNQVQGGLTQFQNELPNQMAGKIDEQLEASSQEMNDGLDQLQAGIVGGFENGLKNKMAPNLSVGLTNGLSKNIADELSQNMAGMPNQLSTQIAKQMAPELVNQQKEQVENIFKIMQQVGISPDQIGAVQQVVANHQPDVSGIEQDLQQKLETGIASQMPSSTQTQEDIAKKIGPGIESGINSAVDQTITETKTSINDGFNQYKTAVNNNLNGATAGLEKQIAQAVNPVFNQLNDGLTAINDGQMAFQDGVNQLADGTNSLHAGAEKLANGQSEYVDNVQFFRQKLSDAATGSNELMAGANELSDGMQKLKDGSNKLNDGTHQIADGSGKLSDGMGELVEGTEEFNEKMNDAAKEAGEAETTEDTYQMMANPVNVKNEKINKVPNYGTGFAPYFLSLGLYVGVLLLSIVYPLREPSVTPTSGFHWFLRKFSGLFVIGVLQALLVSTLLLYGLDLKVQSVPLFYLFSIIVSLVFTTLIQFLVTCFNDPGRFMAIIILILQLTTSAGTFPLELIPKVLQPLNALLPMTYTVAGYKAVISSGDYSVMWQNAGILLGFTVVSILLTLSYFMIMYKRKYRSSVHTEEVTE